MLMPVPKLKDIRFPSVDGAIVKYVILLLVICICVWYMVYINSMYMVGGY